MCFSGRCQCEDREGSCTVYPNYPERFKCPVDEKEDRMMKIYLGKSKKLVCCNTRAPKSIRENI